jgi:hypothetical protein
MHQIRQFDIGDPAIALQFRKDSHVDAVEFQTCAHRFLPLLVWVPVRRFRLL